MPASDAFPRRPPRITPFQDVRSFYFVTFCTRNRRAILARTEVHEAFVDFAIRARDVHAIAVGRYVLMPDHVHLFVVFPEFGPGPRLSRWVGQLKRRLGVALEGSGQEGPFWQEGFFDHLMRGADSYSEKWAYVRQNPLRARLCDSEEDWLYAGEITALRF
jgi:REP element-mobilizing transposase RayT